jgi:hypothetical protein
LCFQGKGGGLFMILLAYQLNNIRYLKSDNLLTIT